MASTHKNYLQELNEVQRMAVTTGDGPVLVVAGPGSGKTRVLTYRIAFLIEEGVAPWEILALTFTNKAAREMKERIIKVVGDRGNQVWAGTFHALFSRILRVEAEKIGYSSNFTIYDTDDTKSVIGAIIKEFNLDKNVYNINAIRARISSAKSSLITPPLYEKDEKLQEEDAINRMPHLAKIYKAYVARCKRSGAMDFDDLLYRFYELLQSNQDGVLEKYRKKFRYLLVDEFQDTNQLQYAIVRKLAHYEGSPRNVYVVGDDAQSIYGFRGATIQNILDFEEDFKKYGIRVYKLEQNYRSTEHIVGAANQVIAFNTRQIPKQIWSDRGSGHRVRVIRAVTDTEEGKRVADTIVEQKHRFHLSNRDFAILYRTNSQSRVFEEALLRQSIPYRVFGGLSFYQRKEIKDMIAYLRMAVNPNDEEALRRIINYPKRGIGDSTVEKIAEQAARQNQTLWQALGQIDLGGRTQKALDEFTDMVRFFAERAQKVDAAEAARTIASKSGLLDALQGDKTIEGMNRLENLNNLLDGIKSFVEEDSVIDTETLPDKSLATYLQNIALLTDLDDNEKTGGDFVTLMSVHAAKGLEFDSVFVVGLEEKLFPSQMALETQEGIDEERRLFYVAMTRAQQHLTLSFANSRYRFGQIRYNEPSRFINEVPREHLESSAALSNARQEESSRPFASVSGAFRQRPAARQQADLKIDPANFHPSPPADIQVGMKVLHQRFGEGKVVELDGPRDNRVATILFQDIDGNPQRKIMLKFAKLQILD